MQVRVKDLMTRDVETCRPSESLASAAMRMWYGDLGILPVVDGDRVVGVITDRDIAMALAHRGPESVTLTTGELASGEIFHCAPEDHVLTALVTMERERVRRLVVLDGERLVGMLSLNDIVGCARRLAALRRPVLAALAKLGATRTPRAIPAAA